MNEKKAINALLGEYRNVVTALEQVIIDVSYSNLTTVVDTTTTNADCQSIQTILTHIISSGYAYMDYIRKLKKINDNRPGKVLRRESR